MSTVVFTIYRCGDQTWQVDEKLDKTIVKQAGKDVVVGFSHSRPWKSALAAFVQK